MKLVAAVCGIFTKCRSRLRTDYRNEGESAELMTVLRGAEVANHKNDGCMCNPRFTQIVDLGTHFTQIDDLGENPSK